MERAVKVRLGPKAMELFAGIVTAASLYSGPEEFTFERTIVDEKFIENTNEHHSYARVEPETVKLNRTISQRLVGSIVNFVNKHVEVSSANKR